MGTRLSRWSGHEPAEADASLPAPPRLLGSLDEPGEGRDLASGRVLVRGWVSHRRRAVVGVVVTANDAVVGGAPVNESRPDVAMAHPDLPGAETSGWSVAVDLSALDGPVRLEVFAVLEARPTADGSERGLGQPRRFAARTFATAGDGSGRSVRGGCFVERTDLTPGHHKIYGLAEAPAGVSAVEVFCEGESAGFARTSLPGRFEGATQGPHSGLALFERVVEIPDGHDEVTFTATVMPCEGPEFEIRPWTASIAEQDVDRWSAERLESVRERTQTLVPASVGQGRVPVRVLVATHDLGLGGGQLYLQELLKRLAVRGLECCVVSPRGGPLVQELEDLGVPVLVTGTFDPHDPESYEAHVRQIVAWGVEHDCRVALINTMSAFAGADAAARMGLEVVWAIHESFPVRQFWGEAYGSPRPAYLERRAEKALARTARAVFEASATLELYHPWIPDGAGVVVPYGVDFTEIDSYRSTVDRSALRAELGFGPDTLVLLCLGTIEPRKAQINIAQALASSEVGGRDVCLVLVGAKKGAPYVEALEDYLEESGETRVRVEPVQPDTYRWYHAADVLISGSDVESLPRSMLEAMAFECPVASTDVFGIPELVTDGVDGFLCRSRELVALRSMIERVASVPLPELKEMGRRARETVLHRHDPEIYVSYYDELLTQLAVSAESR